MRYALVDHRQFDRRAPPYSLSHHTLAQQIKCLGPILSSCCLVFFATGQFALPQRRINRVRASMTSIAFPTVRLRVCVVPLHPSPGTVSAISSPYEATGPAIQDDEDASMDVYSYVFCVFG